MNTLRKTLGTIAATAAITFIPLASTVTPAAAQTLNPAASASCTTPNVPASTIYAALAETPVIATQYQLIGTTLVNVELEPSGLIHDATVAKSSGSMFLDTAAVAAAQASRFSPEIQDCAPIAGSYIFQVDFKG